MCAQLSDFFPLTNDKEKENSSNFRDTLSKYLYHWPLFVIGLLITLPLASVYLQTAIPSYTVKASVIIKDDKKDDPDEREQLQDLQLFGESKLAENELEVFKSRSLIGRVVNDLKLWVTYKKKDGLRTVYLYKNTPVIFNLLDSTGDISNQTFKVKIKDNDSFFLVKADDSLQEFLFKDTLTNSFGTWKLQPTDDLLKYKGSEITIVLSNVSKVAESYQKGIDAEIPNKDAPIIELSLTDVVEQRGKDILNHLIKTYNQTIAGDKNQTTQKTLDFLDNRIASSCK